MMKEFGRAHAPSAVLHLSDPNKKSSNESIIWQLMTSNLFYSNHVYVFTILLLVVQIWSMQFIAILSHDFDFTICSHICSVTIMLTSSTSLTLLYPKKFWYVEIVVRVMLHSKQSAILKQTQEIWPKTSPKYQTVIIDSKEKHF